MDMNGCQDMPFSGLGFDLAPVRRAAVRMCTVEPRGFGLVRHEAAAGELPVAWGYDLMLLHGRETGAS